MVGTADAADDATSAEGRNRRRRGGRKKGQDGPDEDTGLEAQVYENKENSTLAPLVSLKVSGLDTRDLWFLGICADLRLTCLRNLSLYV